MLCGCIGDCQCGCGLHISDDEPQWSRFGTWVTVNVVLHRFTAGCISYRDPIGGGTHQPLHGGVVGQPDHAGGTPRSDLILVARPSEGPGDRRNMQRKGNCLFLQSRRDEPLLILWPAKPGQYQVYEADVTPGGIGSDSDLSLMIEIGSVLHVTGRTVAIGPELRGRPCTADFQHALILTEDFVQMASIRPKA